MKEVIEEIVENGDRLTWWEKVIGIKSNQLAHSILGNNGSSIMEKDWDNLIILDACRYDMFEEMANMEKFDQYTRVTSLGSSTAEWTIKNFSGNKFLDTVYISANANISKRTPDSFHKIVEIWKDYDEDYGVALPETVYEKSIEIGQEYDNKRLIIHFTQPHHPFINSDLSFGGWDPDSPLGKRSEYEPPRTVWEALEMGKVTKEEVWDAYKSNLRIVLNYTYDLIDELAGKTVVSSDHGNMVKERGSPFPFRMYAHPSGVYTDKLVKVPWAVSDGKRKKITEGGINDVETDDEKIEENLKNLGYLE